jgi:hypothetical protein
LHFLSLFLLRVCCVCQYYDSNGNGLIEFDEFEHLISEVVARMAAQLPSQIPARYCLEYGLAPTVLSGVEARIAAKFAAVNKSNLAKAIFLELDVLDTATTMMTDTEQAADASSAETANAAAAASPTAAATAAASSPTAAVAQAAASASSSDATASPRSSPRSSAAAAAGVLGGDSPDPSPVVKGARGFLEPGQLRPLHTLMEKHLLQDLYESIGTMMVTRQMATMDSVR